VIDLRFFGFALRLRWKWLARTNQNSCWASLPSPRERLVDAMCDASLSVVVGDGANALSVVVGDGANALFWTDNWSSVGPLSLFAPALFKATSRTGRKRVLCDALQDRRWVRDICRAITVQVLRYYLRVWSLLSSVSLQPGQPDRFQWKWSSDGIYRASTTYRAFFNGATNLPGARELWKVRASPKVKLFF
jgi:hypothetical protein